MSDPDNAVERFLLRWSRRKQTDQKRPRRKGEPPQSGNAETGSPIAAGARDKPDLRVFDPATLPPIDSITATTDIRAFLVPGVPEELSRAALRRAWAADPAIRDFVGLAENQWDFTKPDAVPGFGSLEPTQELHRMLARIVGNRTERPPADSAPDMPVAEASAKLPPQDVTPMVGGADAAPALSERPLMPRFNNKDGAVQTEHGETAVAPAPRHRRHGGAVPK